MSSNREVCLFLTLNCNQKCRYCHRFLGIDEVSFEDNQKTINRIAEDGIENITFTGGEPLLYPYILELVKLAKQKGLKIKIISNGEILASNTEMREIYNYLDSITLSIDSVNNEINKKLGRGEKHFENIKTVLDSLNKYKIKTNINTVVSKVNLGSLEELGEFLNDYNINAWRIFKFVPLRETAILNKNEFEISKTEFRANRPLFASFPNISKVEFREDDDMESKYILIMPNGDITITENKEDVVIGNILENSISELLNNRKITKQENKVMDKIRTLISYNDEEERESILDRIKSLNYVEVVGVSASGLDTYNKIVALQPEMVFTNYNLNDMNGLELIEKSKEKLNNDIPIFNFISNNISEKELEQVVDIAGNKINALIQENQIEEKIVNALEEYKKFKEN